MPLGEEQASAGLGIWSDSAFPSDVEVCGGELAGNEQDGHDGVARR